jgi:putative sigma-54 modulation protein
MMTVTVTGRHVDISAATRLQIEKKIGGLQRVLNGHAVSAHCVITKERLRVNCELTFHAAGDHMLVGIGHHARLVTAVGLAIDKVSEQARRLADRWKTRKREARRLTEAPMAVEPVAAERTPRVIRARGYSVKPLSVEDAILALDQQPFLVFRHTETERIAVLFRRPDGHLGLIDTEG